ncbi:hypothetical protein ACH5RR_001407 [Cinchona calisaya]|uniref:Uncharacterized protein n=1 Tax=Cinchona calisaya TaxID=153742 RepID=A0ABD3B3Y5_9GENT
MEVATKTIRAWESSNDHAAGLDLILNHAVDSNHIADVNIARETPANAAAHGSDVDIAATCYLFVDNFIAGKHALGAAAAQELLVDVFATAEVTEEAATIPDYAIDVAVQQRKDDTAVAAAQMDTIVVGVASQDFDDTTEAAQLDASFNAAATRERGEVTATAIDSPSVVNNTVNKDENKHHAVVAMGKNCATTNCGNGLYATAVRTTIPATKTV